MTASWSPTTRETDALQRHAHVQRLSRVDAVWPWLADRHGLIAAVDAPHAAHPERFKSFIADGKSHTFLQAQFSREVEGIPAYQWVGDMLSGSADWRSLSD